MPTNEDFVERWIHAWKKPADRFVHLFHAGGTLLQAGMARPITRDEIPQHIEVTLALMPDISNKVKRSVVLGNDCFIEWTGFGTVLGKQYIEWNGASSFTLRDGFIEAEIAYFDTLPLRRIVDPTLDRGDMFAEAMKQRQ